jgi:hypothetical protein
VLSQTPVQSDLVVSLQMLDAQQVTRAQFIDRLSESLFPGKSVDVVLASKSGPVMQAGGTEEDGLLAIQETRVYRFPRQRLSGQQLEQLRQVYIANGELYVKITFVDTSSYDSELAQSAAIQP